MPVKYRVLQTESAQNFVCATQRLSSSTILEQVRVFLSSNRTIAMRKLPPRITDFGTLYANSSSETPNRIRGVASSVRMTVRKDLHELRFRSRLWNTSTMEHVGRRFYKQLRVLCQFSSRAAITRAAAEKNFQAFRVCNFFEKCTSLIYFCPLAQAVQYPQFEAQQDHLYSS